MKTIHTKQRVSNVQGPVDKVLGMFKSATVLKEIHECVSGINGRKVCYTHNRQFGKKNVNLMPGDYFVTSEDLIISTVLGSCISVCFYSEASSFCGMNHFMLPEPGTRYRDEKEIMHTDSAFYGINAMESVINAMIKSGVRREHLKAKVFGGGNVIPLRTSGMTVGEQNVEFTMEFLRMEKIPVSACSVGGDYARKILFFTKTREVLLTRLGHTMDRKIMLEEETLRYGKTGKSEISIFTK
jgi:chemotaxis protein CheD